jgi:hypothetical protein
MSDDVRREPFQPLRATAARIGVPSAWLRAEAKAGRVPHLPAGRELLFDVDQVARVLRERTAQATTEGASA